MMNVLFYDNKKKPIKYKLNKVYMHGGCGSVYRINTDTCLKWFGEDNFYDEEAFETIMKLNLTNFYKIYQMLYDEGDNFVGYTMKYYESSEIDILTMPIEYTINNLYKLYKSINIITSNSIFVRDLRESNIIMNNQDMTVIDVDLYFKNMFYSIRNDLTKNDLIHNNLSELYRLFSEIYFNALATYHYTLNFDKVIIDELFSIDSTPSDIHKKLIKYKYPLDYIKERR